MSKDAPVEPCPGEHMGTPLNLLEYEAAARQVLPAMAYDYFAGGSWDEETLRRNRAAFEALSLYPRFLVDVSKRDLSTQVLGQHIAFPVLVAPTAFHQLAIPRESWPLPGRRALRKPSWSSALPQAAVSRRWRP